MNTSRRGEQQYPVMIGDDMHLFQKEYALDDFSVNEYLCKPIEADGSWSHCSGMYEINYSNGDHYLYEGYETTFQSGYTRALQGFVTNCMREERDPYYYMYY